MSDDILNIEIPGYFDADSALSEHLSFEVDKLTQKCELYGLSDETTRLLAEYYLLESFAGISEKSTTQSIGERRIEVKQASDLAHLSLKQFNKLTNAQQLNVFTCANAQLDSLHPELIPFIAEISSTGTLDASLTEFAQSFYYFDAQNRQSLLQSAMTRFIERTTQSDINASVVLQTAIKSSLEQKYISDMRKVAMPERKSFMTHEAFERQLVNWEQRVSASAKQYADKWVNNINQFTEAQQIEILEQAALSILKNNSYSNPETIDSDEIAILAAPESVTALTGQYGPNFDIIYQYASNDEQLQMLITAMGHSGKLHPEFEPIVTAYFQTESIRDIMNFNLKASISAEEQDAIESLAQHHATQQLEIFKSAGELTAQERITLIKNAINQELPFIRDAEIAEDITVELAQAELHQAIQLIKADIITAEEVNILVEAFGPEELQTYPSKTQEQQLETFSLAMVNTGQLTSHYIELLTSYVGHHKFAHDVTSPDNSDEIDVNAATGMITPSGNNIDFNNQSANVSFPHPLLQVNNTEELIAAFRDLPRVDRVTLLVSAMNFELYERNNVSLDDTKIIIDYYLYLIESGFSVDDASKYSLDWIMPMYDRKDARLGEIHIPTTAQRSQHIARMCQDSDFNAYRQRHK